MSELRLAEDVYVSPTPAGAYYAVAAPDDEPVRRLLFALMQAETTLTLDLPRLLEWTALADADHALDLLRRSQHLGWLQGEPVARPAPGDNMESDIPPLLAGLSGDGKVVLADGDGFYLARSGFTHEAAEELSALSADLASLHRRHAALVHHNLRLPGAAWALVDAAGNSQLGFWPLFIGGQRFALVLAGLPCFNRDGFADLVWALSKRYPGR